MDGRLSVEILTNYFASKVTCSMPKLMKSALQTHQRRSLNLESVTKRGACDTIFSTTTQEAAQLVVVKGLQATLTLDAQWPGVATVQIVLTTDS